MSFKSNAKAMKRRLILCIGFSICFGVLMAQQAPVSTVQSTAAKIHAPVTQIQGNATTGPEIRSNTAADLEGKATDAVTGQGTGNGTMKKTEAFLPEKRGEKKDDE